MEGITMSGEKQELPNRKGISGLVFVGCLLIGLAIGLITGYVAGALLAGLGVGFLAMALTKLITGQW